MNKLSGLLPIIFTIMFFGGWIANVIKFINNDFNGTIRLVGIFVAPLGAILGYR